MLPQQLHFRGLPCPSSFSIGLYQNGKVYSNDILLLNLLAAASLVPNAATNPLGIRVRRGDLSLLGDVLVQGTLLLPGAKSSLFVLGSNNQLQSPPVPDYPEAWHPKEVRVRLPAGIVEESIQVESGGFLGGKGLLLVQKDFVIRKSSQELPSLDWLGNVAAQNISLEPREEWIQTDKWWNQVYTQFRSQSGLGDPNFPRWLQNGYNLRYSPGINIQPLEEGTRPHWCNLTEGLFVPHPEDATPLEAGAPGLRWEVLYLRWLDPPIEGTLEPELSLGFQEPRLIGRPNKPSKKTLPQGVAKRTPADFKFGGLEKKVGPMLGNRRFPLVPFSLRMKETIL
jgi:hypothetical protein